MLRYKVYIMDEEVTRFDEAEDPFGDEEVELSEFEYGGAKKVLEAFDLLQELLEKRLVE